MMQPTARSGHGDVHDRIRAAKACQRCNARRVKCDAIQSGLPCTRCQQAGTPQDCWLRQSKRGTYLRKKQRLNKTAEGHNNASRSPEALVASEGPSHERSDWHGDGADRRRHSSPPRSVTPTTSRQPISHTISTHDDPIEQAPPTSSQPHPQDRHATQASPDRRAVEEQAPSGEGVAEDGRRIDLTSPESNMSQNSTASYREISWTAMFDHFLNGREKEGTDIIDKCSITYLGESFPLALILQDRTADGAPRLHHAGPPLEDSSTPAAVKLPNVQHPSHMASEDIEFLQAKDAFAYPDDDILTALVSTFLEQVYPLYPVVSLHEFLTQYKKKAIPFLLLNAVCFVAATYCPLAALHRGGFSGRKEARFSFYKKAKALFDTGYECNKIAILQSSILLTFWGGGPNNYWNFYSWIGTSVTIAETLGMHRSLAGTNMAKQDRSLLKRLWWILVIRDSFCGALVGRPFRIGMEHSDADMLTQDDFEHDIGCLESEKHPLRDLYGQYQIHMASLALLLREIITTRFGPRKKSQSYAELNSMLQSWRRTLPRELNWSTNTSRKLNVLALSLAIIYNHHLILVNFGSRKTNGIQDVMDGDAAALQAASEKAAHSISELASFIVTRSLVLTVPHEAFSALFVAEVVFYTQVKSAQTLIAQGGRMSLNICQMALHNAREAWDPAPWVMQLFDNLMSDPNEDVSSTTDENEYPKDGIDVNSTFNGFIGDFGMDGDFNALQSNTLLTSLLQLPEDVDSFAGMDFSSGFSNDFSEVMQGSTR